MSVSRVNFRLGAGTIEQSIDERRRSIAAAAVERGARVCFYAATAMQRRARILPPTAAANGDDDASCKLKTLGRLVCGRLCWRKNFEAPRRRHRRATSDK